MNMNSQTKIHNASRPAPMRRLLPVLSLMAAATLSACGGLPQNNALLEQARQDYQALRADPRSESSAAPELKLAADAMARADTAWKDKASDTQINHLAYLASQRMAIVRTTVQTQTARDTVNAAANTRRQIQLDARTQEAQAAQRSAASSQQASQAAQQSAQDAQQATAAAERDAAAARIASTQAQGQTLEALERNRQLEARLQDLQAKPTPRGLVVTLGDVLFAVDQAALQPGGMRVVQQLAAVLVEFPQRNAVVEGHTDSTGSDAYNQTLSTERAEAVRTALLAQGIASTRITARGYGESSPVGSNDTAAGRQTNRRVEIVLSGDNGQVSAR